MLKFCCMSLFILFNPILFAKIQTILAQKETTPETVIKDGIDDPAFWYNEKNPKESRILVTNKNSGLLVYNLSGQKKFEIHDFAYNNVDVRGSLVVATLTNGKEGFQILKMDEDSLTLTALSSQILPHKINPYGMCLFKDGDELFVFLTGRKGDVEQFKIEMDQAAYVRTLKVETVNEGCVVDDLYKTLYVAEEGRGLWKFDARADGSKEPTLVAGMDENRPYLKADLEGVALLDDHRGGGQIILSVQGINQFAMFDRITGDYIKSFEISGVEGKAEADPVTETDGIDIFNGSLPGTEFEKGILMVQDDQVGSSDTRQQNIKFISLKNL